MSESDPSIAGMSEVVPVSASTALNVYNGLVPISPNTMPSADSPNNIIFDEPQHGLLFREMQ